MIKKAIFFLNFLTLFFFSDLLFGANNQINGLLIEGSGYAGKTTICELLLKRLSQQHSQVQYHHFCIDDSEMSRGLSTLGRNNKNMCEAAQLFAAGYLVNLISFNPHEGVFYLQDRNWLSAMCNNEFFSKDSGLSKFIIKNRASFRWNVLLTVDPLIRRERFLARDKKSLFNQYLFDNPNVQLEVDHFLLTHIPVDESWLVIDTSQANPEETVDIILNFMKQE